MLRVQRSLDLIIPFLNSKQTPYQITGGLAAHLYGSTRDVNDIDIDVPELMIKVISREFSTFVEVDPQRCRDSVWDVYMTTLNYDNQLIDFTAPTDARIFNKKTGLWDDLEMNFDSVVWIDAFGHRLPVQDPNDLIRYKSKIAYDEYKHLADCAAIERYIQG